MNAKNTMIAIALFVLAAPVVSAALLPAVPTTPVTNPVTAPATAPATASSQASEGDGPNGANKYSVAGTGVEYLGPEVINGTESNQAEVMSTPIKTSPGEDLIIQVTMECSIWTTVATVGNDVSEATATVKVWITVDGVVVPVSADDGDDEDAGKVVFCDRTHRQTVTDLDDEDARFETYQRTRSANAFNWIAVDVPGGSEAQDIVVHAELSGTSTDNAIAQAGIGHRTLVVEPVKLIKGDSV